MKPLAPGASNHVRFKFKVREETELAKLKLQIYDGVMGDYLVEKLNFPVRPRTAPPPKSGKKTVMVSKENAAIYAAADGSTDVIARAEAGSLLAAVSEVGPYFRVKIGKELYGFVPHESADPAKGRVALDAKGTPRGLSAVFGRDPPRITITGIPEDSAAVTDSDTLTFEINIADDEPVRDVYVFVRDKKTFYKKLHDQGATQLSIPITAHLEPGVNMITVVAREDDEFAQREVFTVYSGAKDPLLNKRKIERH